MFCKIYSWLEKAGDYFETVGTGSGNFLITFSRSENFLEVSRIVCDDGEEWSLERGFCIPIPADEKSLKSTADSEDEAKCKLPINFMP